LAGDDRPRLVAEPLLELGREFPVPAPVLAAQVVALRRGELLGCGDARNGGHGQEKKADDERSVHAEDGSMEIAGTTRNCRADDATHPFLGGGAERGGGPCAPPGSSAEAPLPRTRPPPRRRGRGRPRPGPGSPSFLAVSSARPPSRRRSRPSREQPP